MAPCAHLRQARFLASPTKLDGRQRCQTGEQGHVQGQHRQFLAELRDFAREHQEHDQSRAQPEGGRGGRAEDDPGEYGERSHVVARVSTAAALDWGRGCL